MSLQQIPGHYIVSATGGGGSNTLYNTVTTGSSYATASGSFTGTQIAESAFDETNIATAFLTGAPAYTSVSYSFPWSAIKDKLNDIQVTYSAYMQQGRFTPSVWTSNNEPSPQTAWPTAALFNDYGYETNQFSASGTMRTCIQQYNSSYLNDSSVLNIGFYSHYGYGFDTSLAMTAMTRECTSTSLPFPDRPSSEIFTATASSVKSEYLTPSGDVYRPVVSSVGGSTAYGSAPGASLPSAKNAASSVVLNLATAEFPSGVDSMGYVSGYSIASACTFTTAQNGLFG